jgi:cytochrome P450
MDAVMNEVLRLYGPFNWIFVRQILTDDFKID